jgi:hypothetical protein
MESFDSFENSRTPMGRPSAVTAKWGEAADAGFQLVSDVLLKYQRILGITATELVVLINLTMHWWYPAQRPFPRSTTIAERMGVEVRTIQRAINHLIELGLIKRVKVKTESGDSTVIDLDGLVSQLRKLAVKDAAYMPRFATKSVETGADAPDSASKK